MLDMMTVAIAVLKYDKLGVKLSWLNARWFSERSYIMQARKAGS